uniref:Uncharacterized protein n=1 Tax=Aegilops tauschii TaxID=37682 RepID=M8AVM3_AEGTA
MARDSLQAIGRSKVSDHRRQPCHFLGSSPCIARYVQIHAAAAAITRTEETIDLMASKSTIRRFVNLIVDDGIPGARSLRRIDLTRHKLFNTTVPVLPLDGDAAPATADDRKTKNMRMIKLPAADFNFQGSGSSLYWCIQCFPLAGRKVLCVDQCGRTSLFDADTKQVDDIRYLDTPKRMPVSIFVPGADDRVTRASTCWRVVPVGKTQSQEKTAERSGTYCLDTAKHTWTQVGDWTLPFVGKVQYVPELKLWFGICADDWQIGAADLSTMDMGMGMDSQQPQLAGAWKELEPPPEWTEIQCPQLVNLGSGRFCVARFFLHSWTHPLGFFYNQYC